MLDWSQVQRTIKAGKIADLMTIRAAPGLVEIYVPTKSGSVELRIPSEMIDQLVDQLAAARDAAALMNSAASRG